MNTQVADQPVEEWKNLFGVCGCIAEDFGFNPLWLRLAFALPLIFAPVVVLSIYAGLGVVVLVTRLLIRNPKPRPAAPATATVHEQDEEERLALAA